MNGVMFMESGNVNKISLPTWSESATSLMSSMVNLNTSPESDSIQRVSIS